MRSWFFSLQFRLILSFALVLALTLGGLSVYIGFAAEREVDRFEREVEEARAGRIEQVVSQHYASGGRWAGLQPILERAGSLYSWDIVVKDRDGHVVGDSYKRFGDAPPDRRRGIRLSPVLSRGREVGTVSIAPSSVPPVIPEPPVTRLVSSLNRSLLLTGIAAAVGGILLISLVSRRALSSIRGLNVAASALGSGDLSQRVPATGRDEVSELGRAFNSMAEGLENAGRQRRNMTAAVAHELRTPLSNVQGYVEALRDGLLEPDAATLNTIHEQVLYLSRLVEDLKLLAETEADDFRLRREPGSLGEVLRSSVDAFRPRADAKGVSVSLALPSETPVLAFDGTRIAQVVGNLLENAIRHTESGGRVAVSMEVEGSSAVVAVADDGEGMPPEELPYIFERFYRTDPSRARSTGGAGLGLTIARQLVEAHGGSIRAESSAEVGSRFSFELPLTDTTGTQRQEG